MIAWYLEYEYWVAVVQLVLAMLGMGAGLRVADFQKVVDALAVNNAEEKERIAKEQARVRRNRKGKRSTILTGPMGIQESEEEKLESLLGKK